MRSRYGLNRTAIRLLPVIVLAVTAGGEPAMAEQTYTGRPWGDAYNHGGQLGPQHTQAGKRRYNPWARLRREDKETMSEQSRAPRFPERKKPVPPELPKPLEAEAYGSAYREGYPQAIYPGGYPPSGYYIPPVPGYVPGWGNPYPLLYPGGGFAPWGYGGGW